MACIARPWLTKPNKYQEVFLGGGYQQPAHLLGVMSPSEDFETRFKILHQVKRITKTEKPNISKLRSTGVGSVENLQKQMYVKKSDVSQSTRLPCAVPASFLCTIEGERHFLPGYSRGLWMGS